MKLWEAIKAIDDGNDNEFSLNGYTDSIMSFRTLKGIVIGELIIPLNGWEEVKPPRQWSEKEMALFKLLPEWAKWIAEDKNGSVWYYEVKPIKNDYEHEPVNNSVAQIKGFDFLTITFEESPLYIGDLKGE